MARFRYDRSSKGIIQHHGRQILRLAGVRDVVSCRALQAEVVQPRQLPDGLLEVQLAGKNTADLHLVEISTYREAAYSSTIGCRSARLVKRPSKVPLADFVSERMLPSPIMNCTTSCALPKRSSTSSFSCRASN